MVQYKREVKNMSMKHDAENHPEMFKSIEKKQSVIDFIAKFDNFKRVPDSGNVIIHPGLQYGFIELAPDFVDDLKNDLSEKITMAQIGIDELSPCEKFVIFMLEDAY